VKSTNVFEREKKAVSHFFRQSQDQIKKKAFSCESAADPASSGKGSFYNQDKWLREIEENEKSSSEKLSVEMSSLKPF